MLPRLLFRTAGLNLPRPPPCPKLPREPLYEGLNCLPPQGAASAPFPGQPASNDWWSRGTEAQGPHPNLGQFQEALSAPNPQDRLRLLGHSSLAQSGFPHFSHQRLLQGLPSMYFWHVTCQRFSGSGATLDQLAGHSDHLKKSSCSHGSGAGGVGGAVDGESERRGVWSHL